MDPKTLAPRPPRTSSTPPSLALAARSSWPCSASPPLAYWARVATSRSRELRYGQFKKQLARGEIRSVKVGPTELTGELTAPGPTAGPSGSAPRGSGMEHDDEPAPAARPARPRRRLRGRGRPVVAADGPAAAAAAGGRWSAASG